MPFLENISKELNDAVTQSGSGGGPKEQGGALGRALYEPFANLLKGQVFTILTTVLLFVTVAFVFYGGFLYFTAYGDENRAAMAKKTITYAIVGFIIAAVAFTIVTFVRKTAESASQSNNPTQVDNPLKNDNANQQVNPFTQTIP